MSEQKYGNNQYWCFLPEGWNGKEVAVWKGPEGSEKIIARAVDKYDAKLIVDALLQHSNTVDTAAQFGKKELAFLEFICSNCIEPYATMASNAMLWNDKNTYEDLKRQFPVIYS